MQEKKKIRTKDGRTISVTCYCASEPIGRCVIIAPAVQVVQKDYSSFAVFFQQQGYHVITFDYRGVGSSAPVLLKGFDAGLHQWAVQDTDAVIRFVRASFLNQELIYIGHGIGGEMIGLVPASQYINKLVLVSSALSCKKLWPWKGRLRIFVMKKIARMANWWYGYFPGTRLGLFRDLPKGVVHEWADWCNNPNGLFDVFPDNNYRKLQVPLLCVSFSDDWLTPQKGVDGLLSYFSSAGITRYHVNAETLAVKRKKSFCFFELQLKSTLWMMLKEWLEEEPAKDYPYIQNVQSLK